jgi:4-hydroxy-3-polyprenylbenzoate decarboxylase
MAYRGLELFIRDLEDKEELSKVTAFADPILEITEITDRVTKTGSGKALLFTNNGTSFPVLINAFGSDRRLGMAIGRPVPENAARELESLFDLMSSPGGFLKKISSLPEFIRIAGILPSRSTRRGLCQEVVHHNPDLGILPILKCWPYDGGRFITLPMVHTVHPATGKTNVGMYRMQVLDRNTTAMHWQRHKTGANHFEAWKKAGRIMPVSVALGGDPVYTYASTAPLPENIDEYILAGFLRKKKVKLVKCITNDLYVPFDADIVIEGYVDPSEDPVFEGPFGDHTGFYSLADWYPGFHVTCITHSRKAVYPATIVGIPPQEDSWLARATERIFLAPVRMALAPEVADFHMPEAGTAHNLVVVKIVKNYPGQGMKVINSLFGAGQMMFSKYIVVVSGDVNIRNYSELAVHVFGNFDPAADILFSRGPLDILDHASDVFSLGGKAGVDATVKTEEEGKRVAPSLNSDEGKLRNSGIFSSINRNLENTGIPVVIVSVNTSSEYGSIAGAVEFFRAASVSPALVLVVDHTVDVNDYFMVAWQLLANSDPLRDHTIINGKTLLIDGTIKAYRRGGFPRKWPNPVCSDEQTIRLVDEKWESLEIGEFIVSPSSRYRQLCRPGEAEIRLEII